MIKGLVNLSHFKVSILLVVLCCCRGLSALTCVEHNISCAQGRNGNCQHSPLKPQPMRPPPQFGISSLSSLKDSFCRQPTELYSSIPSAIGNENYGNSGNKGVRVTKLFPTPDSRFIVERNLKRSVLVQWAFHLLKFTFNLWKDFRLGSSAISSSVSTATLSRPLTRNDTRSRTQIHLVDISWLKAHEAVVSDERVSNLADAIRDWDEYKLPLLVDIRTGAILDGHHRYAVGRQLGLSRLPAVLVDYLHDDSITVNVWPGCGIDHITKKDVVQMSLSDTVFPPKTSRHEFVSSLSPISIPLINLR